MSEYNIQMNKYNALNAEYDQLYPQPMKHASTHAKDGDDPITPSSIGAAELGADGKVLTSQLPSIEVDAYTKVQTLSDTTKTLFGLDANAVPDDMWVNLVPVGGILWYAKDNIPNYYLKCDGSLISRADYARLFAVIGTSFGEGDGSTTFALPDLRAAFIRGAGSQDGYSATFGKKQQATSISNTRVGTFTTFDNPDKSASTASGTMNGSAGSTTATLYAVRPYNMALTPIIKY